MATKTYQEQLEEVQAAITAVLTRGQSHDTNGRSFSRADLAELRRMENDLRRKVARQKRGGIRILRVRPR